MQAWFGQQGNHILQGAVQVGFYNAGLVFFGQAHNVHAARPGFNPACAVLAHVFAGPVHKLVAVVKVNAQLVRAYNIQPGIQPCRGVMGRSQ